MRSLWTAVSTSGMPPKSMRMAAPRAAGCGRAASAQVFDGLAGLGEIVDEALAVGVRLHLFQFAAAERARDIAAHELPQRFEFENFSGGFQARLFPDRTSAEVFERDSSFILPRRRNLWSTDTLQCQVSRKLGSGTASTRAVDRAASVCRSGKGRGVGKDLSGVQPSMSPTGTISAHRNAARLPSRARNPQCPQGIAARRPLSACPTVVATVAIRSQQAKERAPITAVAAMWKRIPPQQHGRAGCGCGRPGFEEELL